MGETVKVKLQPEEAFGDYDEELIQIESRDQFPKELQVGMQFEGGPEGGDDDDFIIYRVTDIADDKVVLDGNHPLAGMSLIFTCTVTAVRPASEEELAHGHVLAAMARKGTATDCRAIASGRAAPVLGAALPFSGAACLPCSGS